MHGEHVFNGSVDFMFVNMKTQAEREFTDWSYSDVIPGHLFF